MSATPSDRRTMLARRIRVDIDTGTSPTVSWNIFRGVQELNPIIEPRSQDDETYDDEGWMRKVATGAAWRLEIKFKHSTQANGTSLDSVHAFLRTKHLAGAASDTITAEFPVRFYDREGRDSGYEFIGRAWVETWARDSNASGDTEVVSVTLSGQGVLTPLTNPSADFTPVVTSLDPATGAEAGGELINVYGTHFTGTTDVDFGANEADFTVVSDSHIVAVAPAGTSTVQVQVTNATGASADTSADNYVYT